MTEVTFFEDFYCFEYHTLHDAPQRFRYYLHSPVYEGIPFLSRLSTHCELVCERTVHSSDFLPCRLVRCFKDSETG